MATTIQNIELPKKPRARDTSNGWQTVGSELIANGAFASDTAWSKSNGTISGGKGVLDGTSVIAMLWQDVLTNGETYRVTFNVEEHNGDITASQVINNAGQELYVITGNGTGLTFDFTHANDNGNLLFRAKTGSTFKIDNVSVLKLEYFPNNNHGQIYSGRGLEFDGVTDYLDTGSEITVSTGAWTVAAWINIHALTESVAHHVSSASSSISSKYIGVRSNGKIAIWDFGVTWRNANTVLNLNTWYRALWVYDGAREVTFYVNGVADGTGVLASTYDDLKVRYLGAMSPGNRYFDGMMSNYQAWDAAFTADDAAYDYLNPESLALNASSSALTESNLKLWYPMQDGHRGQQSYILDGANTGLGVELVTNGDFATDSDWTTGTGILIEDGVCKFNGNNNANISQNIGLVAGEVYKATFTISNYESGELDVNIGGSTRQGDYAANGTYEVIEASANSGTLYFQENNAAGGFVGHLDNISVKAINDKHHATTAFYGDELIPHTNDRTFAGASNWANAAGDNAFANYDETGSGQLTVTPDDVSDVQYAFLDGAIGDDWEASMIAGRTYRLTYDIHVSAFTKGTLSVGLSTDAVPAVMKAKTDYTATNGTGATATLDFVYGPTAHEMITIYAAANTVLTADFDNFSLKEVGVASGWTDADQQLHIPQTALQSYNELAWATDWGEQVEIADHNDFSFDTDNNDDPFSLSVWVYVADFTGSFFVFTKGGYSSSRHQLEYRLQINSSGIVYFYLHDGPTTDGGSSNHLTYARWFTATNTIEKGKWYNIVTTYSGTTPSGTSDTNGKIYVNGAVVSTTSSQASYARMSNQAHSLMMHKAGQSGSFGAPGSITEAAVWNKALSAAEVVELFNDGKALEASAHSAYSSVLGYWRNNGLSTWTNIKNPGTHDGVVTDFTETILIPEGVDATRDSQGFLMNKKRSTGSLNIANGSDVPYVDLGTETDIAAGSAYSIAVWLKPDDLAHNYFIGANGTEDSIRIHSSTIIKITADNATALEFDVGSGDMVAGEWFYFAATKDTDNVWKVYIDDAQNGSASADTEDNDEPLGYRYLGGRDKSGATANFRGQVDGFLIYNTALSATEVLQNYNATKRDHKN